MKTTMFRVSQWLQGCRSTEDVLNQEAFQFSFIKCFDTLGSSHTLLPSVRLKCPIPFTSINSNICGVGSRLVYLSKKT